MVSSWSNLELVFQPLEDAPARLSVRGEEIDMSAHDRLSNETESISFQSFGASAFLGSPKVSAYVSSLMTEWYHVLPFFCSGQVVIYSNKIAPLTAG